MSLSPDDRADFFLVFVDRGDGTRYIPMYLTHFFLRRVLFFICCASSSVFLFVGRGCCARGEWIFVCGWHYTLGNFRCLRALCVDADEKSKVLRVCSVYLFLRSSPEYPTALVI